MDTHLAITSRRDVKTYARQGLADELEARILDAGRLAGSARNRQPWRFLVVRDARVREELAQTVYVPENVQGAALVVALLGSADGSPGFDCGRAAQNMMLAAWNEGIGSTPNGLADPVRAREVLDLDPEWALQVVLTFGYPARPSSPEERTAQEWSRRADRLSPEQVVRTI